MDTMYNIGCTSKYRTHIPVTLYVSDHSDAKHLVKMVVGFAHNKVQVSACCKGWWGPLPWPHWSWLLGERPGVKWLHGSSPPKHHMLPLPWGHRPTPAPCTWHHWPHVLCSVALVATPAESHTSNKTLEFSGDVTDRSKAAGLPTDQLGTRMSAGREWVWSWVR